MWVAEELFLLPRRAHGYGLIGAVLREPPDGGHITLGDDKDQHVSVTAQGSVGDPVLTPPSSG